MNLHPGVLLGQNELQQHSRTHAQLIEEKNALEANVAVRGGMFRSAGFGLQYVFTIKNLCNDNFPMQVLYLVK